MERAAFKLLLCPDKYRNISTEQYWNVHELSYSGDTEYTYLNIQRATVHVLFNVGSVWASQQTGQKHS